MRSKMWVVGLLAMGVTIMACDDDSNTNTLPVITGEAGTTGTAGNGEAGTGAAGAAGTGAAGAAGTGAAGATTGAAGTMGAAGSTGAAGAGMSFTAIAPCNSASAYVTGTTVTVDPNVIGYMPACLKVAPGTTVTIGASNIHPLSARTGGSANNPIPMHQTTPQTVTFPTAGFYPFQCDVHFSVGMMGVIWVSP